LNKSRRLSTDDVINFNFDNKSIDYIIIITNNMESILMNKTENFAMVFASKIETCIGSAISMIKLFIILSCLKLYDKQLI